LAYQAAMSEGAGKDMDPGQTELLRLKLQDLGDAESPVAATGASAPIAK
jgi:hypothetical protein